MFFLFFCVNIEKKVIDFFLTNGEGGVFLADTFVHICFSLFFKFAAAVSIDFWFKFFNSNVVCLL
ncbi:MAG: hypothetical protein EGR36_00100 [Eubacterium ventriosum]|nr:hypothetical protein [Eubacterium ventriosum]